MRSRRAWRGFTGGRRGVNADQAVFESSRSWSRYGGSRRSIEVTSLASWLTLASSRPMVSVTRMICLAVLKNFSVTVIGNLSLAHFKVQFIKLLTGALHGSICILQASFNISERHFN